MVKAKANMSLPAIESVTLTLDIDEATHLVKFLGQTQIFTVQGLLPSASEETQRAINDTLYDVYENLNSVLVEK